VTVSSRESGELSNSKKILLNAKRMIWRDSHYKRLHTFFSGWIPRFGSYQAFFTFPLLREAEPQSPTTTKQLGERCDMFAACLSINTDIGSESSVLEAQRTAEGGEG